MEQRGTKLGNGLGVRNVAGTGDQKGRKPSEDYRYHSCRNVAHCRRDLGRPGLCPRLLPLVGSMKIQIGQHFRRSKSGGWPSRLGEVVQVTVVDTHSIRFDSDKRGKNMGAGRNFFEDIYVRVCPQCLEEDCPTS